MGTLKYGKVSWSYEERFDPSLPCRPSPFLTLSPVKMNGKWRTPELSERTMLELLKLKGTRFMPFTEAYREWFGTSRLKERELGEGRSFLLWARKEKLNLKFCKSDIELHPYFAQKNSPRHAPDDEMASGLSFAAQPVKVEGRTVKLYLQDEAIMNLISMPFGHDTDFRELMEDYVRLRFQWEVWRAPAPTFLDWVKAQAKRPVFSQGQLGFCL